MGRLLTSRRSLLAAPAILLLPRGSWARGHGTALNDLPTGSTPTQPPPQGAASIQYPTLFTAGWTKLDGTTGAYVTRPGWRVPGVDYYTGFDRVLYPTAPVGGSSNGSLADGSSNAVLNPLGASISAKAITMSGNNLTFEGINFDFANIQEIDVTSSTTGTLTFSNCNFIWGASIASVDPIDINAPNTNVQFINCTIDMSGQLNTTKPQEFMRQSGSNTTGSTTFKYCSILNMQGAFSNTNSGNISYLYSYFNGGNFSSGAHGEWMKLNFNGTAAPGIQQVLVSFCTFVMPFTDGGGMTAPVFPTGTAFERGKDWFIQIDHNVFVSQPWQFTGGISNGSGGAGTILNITAMSGGSAGVQVAVGFSVTGPGVTAGTIVTALDGTGTGGTGTYHVNNSQLVAAGTTLTSNATRGSSGTAVGAGPIYGPVYVFSNYVDPSGSNSPTNSFSVTQTDGLSTFPASPQIYQSKYGNINLVDGSPAT